MPQKIAIVHDSITHFGGAERVLLAVHDLFPDAPIYTLTVCWNNLGPMERQIRDLHPKLSWVQHVPLLSRYPFLYRYALPYLWKQLDLSEYDIVMAFSGSHMSHLIHVSDRTRLICYFYTPPRHLYGLETDFAWRATPVVRNASLLGNRLLRKADLQSVKRIDACVACSREVEERIRAIYARKAMVLYPPLTHFSSPRGATTYGRHYYLVVSRLSRMKHVDMIIRACNRLRVSLKIVGRGPEERALRALASDTTHFLGKVDDEHLALLYAGCKAVMCAARDEDFGMVPIEAMSLGKPAIAYYSGGYKETVIDGRTGVFFRQLSDQSIQHAIVRLNGLSIRPDDCRKQAQRFSSEEFSRAIRSLIF